MGALDTLVKQGKALYSGISSYNGAQYREAVAVTRGHDWAPVTIHQPYYNMLSRGIEGDLLPHTAAAGTGVIVFCPLASGLLTDKYLGGVPADSRAAQKWGEGELEKRLDDKKRAQLVALNEVAKERGQSLAQMALAWTLRLPAITSALIGASKVSQIEENVKALDNVEFSGEELARIEGILG